MLLSKYFKEKNTSRNILSASLITQGWISSSWSICVVVVDAHGWWRCARTFLFLLMLLMQSCWDSDQKDISRCGHGGFRVSVMMDCVAEQRRGHGGCLLRIGEYCCYCLMLKLTEDIWWIGKLLVHLVFYKGGWDRVRRSGGFILTRAKFPSKCQKCLNFAFLLKWGHYWLHEMWLFVSKLFINYTLLLYDCFLSIDLSIGIWWGCCGMCWKKL